MGQDEWLEIVAKFSVYSSVLIVVYFLGHYFIRIARFPNPPWKVIKNRAVEVYKKPVELTFVLQLKEDSAHTPNSVTFHLKANSRAKIKLFWGVSVSYIFELMRCSWSDFQKSLNLSEESQLENRNDKFYQVTDCPFEPTSQGTFEGLITVATPENLKWEDLRNTYRYPLAIVIYRAGVRGELAKSQLDAGNEIHGLFTILHVKSDIFPAPTTVLAHYIKMDNGNTFLLKPLYLVEDDNIDDDSTKDTGGDSPLLDPASSDTFPGVSCSVCQSYPVSRAILPCGHVCLCVLCFEKVERCPICRGEMQFFFRTRDEDYAENIDTEELTQPPPPRSLLDRFDNLNDRINYWMGFRE